MTDETRKVFDLQIWDDPDMDPHLYEDVGDVRIVEGGVLVVLEKLETVDAQGEQQMRIVSAFNAQGWLRYETSERTVMDDQA